MSEPELTPDRLRDLASVGAVSRWVDAQDATLHVLDYGGSRPPCVVIPGITTAAIAWDFVVTEVLDIVRPIVVDVRGRGLSSRASRYGSADYAADIEAIWPALELTHAVLLGHSMGARIAATVAARGAVPLLGTVAVDPPMSGPGRGPYPTPLESFEQQLADARSGTTAEEVAAFYPSWPARELGIRARWLATCDEAAVKETHGAFEEEDFLATWPAVPPPVALIYGSVSPVVTEAGAAEAAQAHQDATVVAVERAGHMVPWDNRSGFVGAVRDVVSAMLGSTVAERTSA